MNYSDGPEKLGTWSIDVMTNGIPRMRSYLCPTRYNTTYPPSCSPIFPTSLEAASVHEGKKEVVEERKGGYREKDKMAEWNARSRNGNRQR